MAGKAAGVTPSIRPAWPMVRGRCVSSLWRTSFDRPGSARIIDIVGENEAFVASIGFDVSSLATQIDVVLGVDFELLGDLGVELAEARPNPSRDRLFRYRYRRAARRRNAAGRLCATKGRSGRLRSASGSLLGPSYVPPRSQPFLRDDGASARHRRNQERSPCPSAADPHCRPRMSRSAGARR